MIDKCQCTHEQGDSDCPIHVQCSDCGADISHQLVVKSRREAVAERDTLRAEVARLRGLLPTVERKLGYLLRDYPDDKETTGLIESIRKESTHVR